MSKPKILVTGANGQLGKELSVLSLSYPEFEFVFLSREDLPLHHFELVRNFFFSIRPDYCINCGAFTAVDKAESEKAMAFLVNAEAVGALAAVSKEYNTKLFHISTDYVFDGTLGKPYTEDDAVNPLNVYGASKLEGERKAMENNADVMVIRTSWVYSSFGKNFVKTMMKLMSEKESINVVSDQVGSPTYAGDLAEFILRVISFDDFHSGIYHFSNDGVTSWYEFAMEIKRLTGSSCQVNPIPTSSYPTPARRPLYSVMSKEKIKKVFGVYLKPWEFSLGNCVAILRQ